MSDDTKTPNGVSTTTKAATGVAAPAVIGAGALTVTGEPTAWVWNKLLFWFVNGSDPSAFPTMPEGNISMFFGALLLAGGYGLYRAIRPICSSE